MQQEQQQTFRLIATCPTEIRSLLMAELHQIGATDVSADFRSVYFSATLSVYYEAHLRLRTASGLLRVIKTVRTPTEAILYAQSSRIVWPQLFDSSHSFRVDGIIAASHHRQGLNSTVVSKKIKEGILHSFRKKNSHLPTIELKTPQVLVVGYSHPHKCTISISTAGQSLHRRGYRSHSSHPAPLKETLAAAVLQQIGYCGRKPLLDGMCGSGTIAIEAAMIARRQAPLLQRPAGVFGFERLRDFDRNIWNTTHQQLQHEIRAKPAAPIFASDINARYVQLARTHANKAGVDKYITFTTCPFAELKVECTPGTVIANLPYGDRMGSSRGLTDLYRATGNCLKQNFTGWEAVLITATYSPWHSIGLRPRKKFKFFNGKIEIIVLLFDLYAGSRKRISRPDLQANSPTVQ